jgi:hypothetical protein
MNLLHLITMKSIEWNWNLDLERKDKDNKKIATASAKITKNL